MTTLSTPDAESDEEAERSQPPAPRRSLSRLPLYGEIRRPKFTLIEVVLCALVVVTAMAIASISLWWIPVYLGALIVIFAAPARSRHTSRISGSGEESKRDATVAQDPSSQVDCSDGVDELQSAGQLDLDLVSIDATGQMNSDLDLPSASATKRRSRVRTRKGSGTVNGPATDSRPVAWIQVGPGKFVRVEGGTTATPEGQVEVEAVAPRVAPVPEIPAEATPMTLAETESLAEHEPFILPEVSCGEVGLTTAWNSCVSEPVTEEYGNAPSAFGPATEHDTSVEAHVDELRVHESEPQLKTTVPGEPDNPLLPEQSDRTAFLYQRRVSRSWVGRIQRGTAQTVPRAGRKPRRNVTRQFAHSQDSVGSRNGSSVLRHGAAGRTIGRALYVNRLIRIRSPPSC